MYFLPALIPGLAATQKPILIVGFLPMNKGCYAETNEAIERGQKGTGQRKNLLVFG
jgi:hypothetical protein